MTTFAKTRLFALTALIAACDQPPDASSTETATQAVSEVAPGEEPVAPEEIAPMPPVEEGMAVVEKEPGGRVTAADPDVEPVKPEAPPEAAPDEAGKVAAVCTSNCTLSPRAGRRITPPGGATSSITVYGTSRPRISRPFPWWVPCQVDYLNSNSTAAWLGVRPINATSVSHTDIWDTDFVGLSISIGWPPSGSITTGRGQQSWTTTVNRTWRTTHSWDRIRMRTCGAGRITGVNYNLTGSFQFGSAHFGVSAFAGSGVI